MQYTKWFKDLTKTDAAIAGGKGASLGEMTQAGIPVPNGFVILAETFEQFLQQANLVASIDAALEAVDHNAVHTVELASESIQALVRQAEMPASIALEIQQQFQSLGVEYVAVRSSATAEDGAEHAWAGQLNSYLNTTESDLLVRVQDCWASLFTPRAIFYRFEKGLQTTHISVAVVVQKMVASEVSGIAFSVHPVTEDRNQLIIEAGFGLGEAIVSGAITPDAYVVSKAPRAIIETSVATQTRGLYRRDVILPEQEPNEWRDIAEPQASSHVLSEAQILELSEIVVGIEQYYGFPCDIEWAYEAGQFYIVQSRPITTLSQTVPVEGSRQVFRKSYTRNFSIIMQEAWFAANKQGLIDRLQLTEYPFDPPYIYFMKDGVEEVWENVGAHEWLMGQLKHKLEQEPNFFLEVYERYNVALQEIQPWWNKDITNLADLQIFVDKVYEAVKDFVILYGVIGIPTAPQDHLKLAHAFRKTDIFFASCDKVIYHALQAIYPSLGHAAVYITKEELGAPINEEEIKSRDSGFGLIPGTYAKRGSFNNLVASLPQYTFTIERPQSDTAHLTGQSAYKGVVTGVVRIVKRKDQIDQVQEGEVIVSPMTTPDMMPAMKKAIAFVTDEGGITCHAAIVARELQKPCIIGTKFAAEVLHDGDLVEVDANKGVIKRVMGESEKTDTFNPDNYVRMFAGKSFFFLYSDNFLGYYAKHGVLSMQNESQWMSFFPKSELEKTLQYGKELYTNKAKVSQFIETFKSYIENSVKVFEEILAANELTGDMVEKFLALVSEHFEHYSKTEFFHTDQLDPENMAISVAEFDELKLGGRSHLNTLLFEEAGYLRRLVTKIGQQTQVPVLELLAYTNQELVDLVKFGSQLSKEQLEERNHFFVSGSDSFFGEKALGIVKQFFTKYSATATEIKGTIANKGFVVAKARVLLPDFNAFEQIQEAVKAMEEGEVLVAETTSPEIIQACKKAGAIVTNQGGMLSHAAIISRELNVPCIIGTDKDVTKSIKTGDLVEVDANKGVIKIIQAST